VSEKRKKIVVAMSGGVDSSVAAAMLQRQGHEVLGCFMRLGTPPGVEKKEETSCQSTPTRTRGCCSVLDADDARKVAGVLDIPLYVLNFQEDFSRVIDYFVSEYNRGRTPNPCVRCNDWLKFGRLAQYADAVGADCVASGHYARVEADPITGQSSLMRAADEKKDQSYVLFGMSRQVMERTMFPLGHLHKNQVRELAREFGLPVSEKPDSQDICFVPDGDYAGLLERHSPEQVRPGDFVLADGQKVGVHRGHQHFTIGQRKGLGVALGRPMYVVGINVESNSVVLGQQHQTLKRGLAARGFNVLSSRLKVGEPMRCLARIRHNHIPGMGTATLLDADELRFEFDEPESAITPGQAVALYSDDVVLGGGWIEQAMD
jgi:tRNA-uridine 2-sulfurtransferase